MKQPEITYHALTQIERKLLDTLEEIRSRNYGTAEKSISSICIELHRYTDSFHEWLEKEGKI